MLEKYVKIWKKRSKQFWQTRLTTSTKLLTALCLCFAANNVYADNFRHFSEWTAEEQSWYSANIALHYVDYRQTMWMVKQKHPNGQWMYAEANPMFSKRVRSHQIASAKIIGLALQYWAIGKYGFEDNTVEYSVKGTTVLTSLVIMNNHAIGINVSVAF